MVCAVVADGEELAGFDEEEAVVHGVGMAAGFGGDGGEVGFELLEARDGIGEEGAKGYGGGCERGVVRESGDGRAILALRLAA